MKNQFLFILITLLLLPAFFTNYQISQTVESSNQSLPYFQVEYSGINGSLTNFDVQNINLQQQANLYISVVQKNNVYYNSFSFNQLTSLTAITFNNFKPLNVSTNYLNDSTVIQASQYYAYGNYNVFVIYYQYKNINFAYIFVIDSSSNTIISSKLISNVLYYKTNKIIQFSTSNDLWIEMRNSSSLFIMDISSSNFSISKPYQSANIPDQGYLSINDVQFYNDTLYVLFNYQNSPSSVQSFSRVYILNVQKGSSILQSDLITSADHYSSITVQNNNLFALSELNSSVTEYDLTSFQPIDQIGIGTGSNHSLLRSFSNNDFIIGSKNSIFQQYNVQNNLFSLKQDLFNLYIPQSANEFYTLELLNSNNVQSYFLAGYVKSNNVNTGFALVFENIQTKPNVLIDNNNQGFTTTSTVETTSQNLNSFIPIIGVILIIVLIFGGILFLTYRIDSGKAKKGKTMNQTNGSMDSLSQDVIKTCPACGSKIYKPDVFCQNCGEKI